jgi:hypothetical protein
MSNLIIFLSGFTLSFLVYGILARSLWWNYLESQSSSKTDALLLVPHTFRHLGLLVLVPEVVGEPVTKTAFAAMLALEMLSLRPWPLLRCGSGYQVTKMPNGLYGYLVSLRALIS